MCLTYHLVRFSWNKVFFSDLTPFFGREKVKCYCLSERCKKWHFEFVVLIVNPDESKNIFLLVLTGPRNAQGQFHAGIRFNATIMFILSLFSILHLRLKWASHYISKNNFLKKILNLFLQHEKLYPLIKKAHFLKIVEN